MNNTPATPSPHAGATPVTCHANCKPCRGAAGSAQRRQRGFTLVELITVILVLGVLAAVALPRFTNVQGKAREAKVNAIAGSMRAAASLVKANAMANGVSCEVQTGVTVVVEGLSVGLNHCYPQALGAFGIGILGVANVSTADNWVINPSNPGNSGRGSYLTIQLSDAETPADCSVTYRSPPVAAAAPTITTTVSGC